MSFQETSVPLPDPEPVGAHELRRRLRSISATLLSERKERRRAEESSLRDVLELETRAIRAEARETSSRLEVSELKRRVGLLEKATPESYAEVFERYERDIERSERECARVRRENVEVLLETSAWAEDEKASSANPSFPGGSRSTGVSSSVLYPETQTLDAIGPEAGRNSVLASRDVQRRLDRLCASLRKSEEARERLALETAEAKRRDRIGATRRRALEDAMRRNRVLESRHRESAEAMREARLETARANALRETAEEEVKALRDALFAAEEKTARAFAEKHRAEARCHELEAFHVERRRAGTYASSSPRAACLESAEVSGDASEDVPNQPAGRRFASAPRRAAEPAGTSRDPSRVSDVFDAFVEDIERGLRSRKRETANSGDGKRDAGDDFATDDFVTEDFPIAAGAADGSRNPASATPSVPRARAREDIDRDPEPVSGYDGPTASTSGPSSSSAARGKRQKIKIANKKLTLRAPPVDTAAAAAAAAAARSVLPGSSPFVTDETYDFLFDGNAFLEGFEGGAAFLGDSETRGSAFVRDGSFSVSGNARGGESFFGDPPIASPRSAPERQRNLSSLSAIPGRNRPGHRAEDARSPLETHPVSSVGGSTRFRNGRSPSPNRRFTRDSNSDAPPSPSSLARSPPGSPRRFYPAGRKSIYAHEG